MTKNIDDLIKGIVIKTLDFREADQLITILTTNGDMVTLLAKGTKKIASKNRTSCQLFTKGEYEILKSNKTGYYMLKRGVYEDNFLKSVSDFNDIAAAYFICECLLKAYDAIEQKIDMYQLLENCLLCLKSQSDVYLILSFFLIKLYEKMGLNLNFNECVICGSKKNITGLSAQKGGYYCGVCLPDNQQFTKEQLKLLKALSMATLLPLSVSDLKIAFKNVYVELMQVLDAYGHFYVKPID